MIRRQVGSTSLEVTSLGFGAAPIGNLFTEVSDDDARDAVSAAWQGGVRYFDTAPHYGLGLSERRLGAALRGHDRESFVISTKVGRLLTANPHPTGSDLTAGGFATSDALTRTIDYSEEGVRRSLTASLDRLGTSRIDIVYVHDPDDYVDQVIEETFPALARMRDEGLIGAIGAGMNDWRPLLRFVESCDVDVVMIAGRWTLLDRSGAPLLVECARRGVSVVAAAPFNSGILATSRPSRDHRLDYKKVSPERLTAATALAELCSRHGIELPHAALHFPLRHDAVVAVVAGAKSGSEARLAAQWMDHEIPGELWHDLDAFGDQETPVL